jgi:hypothetical protein
MSAGLKINRFIIYGILSIASTASPDIMRKPGTLIHRGIIILFIITSQPKYNRRRCMNAITKKTIIQIEVKGSTVLFLFSPNFGIFSIDCQQY